jgi:hypothetical protein
MNQFRLILVATAAMAALTAGVTAFAHPGHDQKQEVREIRIIKSDGKEEISKSDFVADCGKGRKFESSASKSEGTKNKSVSKIVICSDPGESDEAWAKTLRGALANVEGNKDMPAEAKAQIMADLRSEIAKTGK